MTSTILLIAAAIIVILLLRSSSEKKIDMPGNFIEPPPPHLEPEPVFEMIEGEIEGVPYTADAYDNDSVMVSIDIVEPLKITGEVNARDGRPDIENDDPFKAEAEELLNLGAVYIDVTGEADWISADFPLSIKMDEVLAGKVARLLIRIKQKASGETQSPLQ